jgi:hypothetical protein
MHANYKCFVNQRARSIDASGLIGDLAWKSLLMILAFIITKKWQEASAGEFQPRKASNTSNYYNRVATE